MTLAFKINFLPSFFIPIFLLLKIRFTATKLIVQQENGPIYICYIGNSNCTNRLSLYSVLDKWIFSLYIIITNVYHNRNVKKHDRSYRIGVISNDHLSRKFVIGVKKKSVATKEIAAIDSSGGIISWLFARYANFQILVIDR